MVESSAILYSLYCRGALLIWITLAQGPVVLAAGAGCVLFNCFFLFSYAFVSVSKSH